VFEQPIDRVSIARPYAVVCWLLAFLFAVPLTASALQRWAPQPWLPRAEVFHGLVPFCLSFPVQCAALAAMLLVSWRVQRGRLVASARLGNVLAWAAALYVSIALGRLAFGVGALDPLFWHRVSIPAYLHAVFGAFVLTLALFHRRERDLEW
jgi:hypothetical protein